MSTAETKLIRATKRAADVVDRLKELTRQSGTVVVDAIIPDIRVIELMVESDKRNWSSQPHDGVFRFLALDLGTAYVKLFVEEMCRHPLFSVIEQYRAITEMSGDGRGKAYNDVTIELDLYEKWLRCIKKEEGYSFYDTGIESEGMKQYIARGPGDKETIKTLTILTYIQEMRKSLDKQD